MHVWRDRRPELVAIVVVIAMAGWMAITFFLPQ